MTQPPENPKLYHIAHVDRLKSIVKHGKLCSDAIVRESSDMGGTQIGIEGIKKTRAIKTLKSYPDLHVGDCVPFNFCPRSVMLQRIHVKDLQLSYTGGQGEIIHLQMSLDTCIRWADQKKLRWVFTDYNAAKKESKDFKQKSDLKKIDWRAVITQKRDRTGHKQAEFLIEKEVSFDNVLLIGVHSLSMCERVKKILDFSHFSPNVEIRKSWYY